MSLYENAMLEVEEVKKYLKVEEVYDDDLIISLTKSACELAEEFLGTDFTGSTVPEAVKTWIKKKVARDYQDRVSGVASERLGDYSVGYEEVDYSDLYFYRKLPGV